MDIKEYRAFLDSLDDDELREYLWSLDWDTLTKKQQAELSFYLQDMKRKKVMRYLMIFGFLVLIKSLLIKYLEMKKPTREELELDESDLVWVCGKDPCQECAYNCGKIYGKTTDDIPGEGFHKHCKCKFVRVYHREAETMKSMRMKLRDAGAIRAVLEGGKRTLEVLAAPYGSMNNKDRLGQYLSARTDFMIEVGDRRPTLYYHGFSPRSRKMEKPSMIGTPANVTKIDDEGLWMVTELDDSPLATRTWEAALKGEARASTGSVNYLERHSKVTGEVMCWPIAELSVFDGGDDRIPVSDDAVVIPLRSLFDECQIQLPESFEAGEDKDEAKYELHQDRRSLGVYEMEITEKDLAKLVSKSVADTMAAERAIVAAEEEKEEKMRAKLQKELEETPQYRKVFNVNKIKENTFISEEDAKRGVTKESREEHNAFVWNLMHPSSAPRGWVVEGGGDRSMRVLEESEALEGGPMVPADMLNKIIEIRGERSLVTKLGLHRYQTDKLIFNFPTETAAMTALALIAEEGAYIANEPAFATVAATVGKYGSMVTVTEEMLDDQDLFEPYFIKAVARAWYIAENLQLFTKLKATDTVGVHDATFTDALIMDWFFSMLDEWVADAQMVLARATLGVMRALLIATPRAYGAFPEFGGGDYPSFMGMPVHTDLNWEAVGAGDLTLTLSMVSASAVGWVENKGLQIKVDPYGDSLNGRVRYFPRKRFTCEILQALGHVTYTDHA